MKKILTLSFNLLITITLFGQSFEGKIIYANSYKSKNPKITDQFWTSMMGSTTRVFYKRW
jgi:hypothetical protein